MKRPRLAATLRRIAEDPMSFYTGSLAADIVADIQENGQISTMLNAPSICEIDVMCLGLEKTVVFIYTNLSI